MRSITCAKILFSLLLLSAGALLVDFAMKQFKSSPSEIVEFEEALKDRLNFVGHKSVHERKGVLKQFWFRPIDNPTLLRLYAERSELYVHLTPNGSELNEVLHDMKGFFQEALAETESKKLKHLPPSMREPEKQNIRVIASKKALYDYSSQLLSANKVALSVYKAPPGTPLEEHIFKSMQPALNGIAQKITLDLRSQPPRFWAVRFSADYKTPSQTDPEQ